MSIFGNSAEEEINLSFVPGIKARLWIKRDDLIHPFISGNKWRKLEGIIDVARANNINHLQTYGGAFSNHLVATACAGAVFGFKTTGIVRGEEVKNHVLNLCSQFGMELHFISREEMRHIRTQNDTLTISGQTLIVPEGGNCPEAWTGCKKIPEENQRNYDQIWLAVGTGTTITGIGYGTNPSRLHGVMVLKDQELSGKLAAAGFNIHHGFERGGYAKIDTELLQETKVFTQHTGILLDPIYTGKLWLALKQHLLSLPEDTHVLMIHSGGLTGWFSDKVLGIK